MVQAFCFSIYFVAISGAVVQWITLLSASQPAAQSGLGSNAGVSAASSYTAGSAVQSAVLGMISGRQWRSGQCTEVVKTRAAEP